MNDIDRLICRRKVRKRIDTEGSNYYGSGVPQGAYPSWGESRSLDRRCTAHKHKSGQCPFSCYFPVLLFCSPALLFSYSIAFLLSCSFFFSICICSYALALLLPLKKNIVLYTDFFSSRPSISGHCSHGPKNLSLYLYITFRSVILIFSFKTFSVPNVDQFPFLLFTLPMKMDN